MRSRILALLLALSVLLAGVPAGSVAQSDDPAWADDLYQQLESMVDVYNDNVDSLDLPIGEGLLQSARVTVEISDSEGNVVYYSFETDENKRITSISREAHENPTLRIITTRETMQEIATAQDPVAELGNEVMSGDVRLEGVTFANAVLTTALEVVRSVADLVGY